MMGMMINCSGCNQKTTCLFAAQYTHKNQPLGSKKAVLYWDEGGYVTGMYEEILYPDRDQP